MSQIQNTLNDLKEVREKIKRLELHDDEDRVKLKNEASLITECAAKQVKDTSPIRVGAMRRDLRDLAEFNTFTYILSNYKEKEKIEFNHSDCFYTGLIGYRLQLLLKFTEGDFGIYVRVVKGDHDDLLQWPFRHRMKLILINQIDEGRSLSYILYPAKTPAEDQCLWTRNTNGEYRSWWGFKDFIKIKDLRGGDNYASEYLRNDRICVRIEFLPPE